MQGFCRALVLGAGVLGTRAVRGGMGGEDCGGDGDGGRKKTGRGAGCNAFPGWLGC